MAADSEAVRSEVQQLVQQVPAQASVLCVERYLATPARALLGEVLDQVFADGDSGHSAREAPGRKVCWRDASGGTLVAIDVHPVEPDFEDALLPRVFPVIAATGLALEIWCDTQTILDGRRAVERWEGRDPLNRSASVDPTSVEQAALERLEQLGCQVTRQAEGTVVVREHVSRAQPWMLVLLPLFFWVLPFALLFARRALWNYFDRALETRRYRSSWRLEPTCLRAHWEGEGEPSEDVEIPVDDVVAVSFAPAGCRVRPDVLGVLRVVGRAAVHRVPSHLPDLAPADQQAMGTALKQLLQAATLRLAS